MIPASEVREVLVSLTDAPFEVIQPGQNWLRLKERAVWLVACQDLAFQRKTAHLDRSWLDKGGVLWLETMRIDDMISLVERKYGEEGVTAMPSAEPGAIPTRKIPAEVARFPDVVAVLKKCEAEVSEESAKTGVHLEVLYDGGGGVTTFRIAARIESPSANREVLRQQVSEAAKVLKQAYDRVCKVVWG